MKIFVACEESQRVTIELRALGHEAYSCDIRPCSGGHPEWHLQTNALELLKMRWDMIIAFPPCTYLSNAGACRLYPRKGELDAERYKKGLEAKEFFLKFLNADCPRVAVENPISSRVFEMPRCTQEIQPWQFGHPYTKKTRLWLRGLPKLKPTDVVSPVGAYVPSCTAKKDKTKYGAAIRGDDARNRSLTFSGIAKAMAVQWAGFPHIEKTAPGVGSTEGGKDKIS